MGCAGSSAKDNLPFCHIQSGGADITPDRLGIANGNVNAVIFGNRINIFLNDNRIRAIW